MVPGIIPDQLQDRLKLTSGTELLLPIIGIVLWTNPPSFMPIFLKISVLNFKTESSSFTPTGAIQMNIWHHRL